MQTAVFANGCFWCTEAVFVGLKGVKSVVPGFAGGTVANPSYEQVCTGKTGHAECLKIEFDPAVISFGDLLSVFFNTHDPTTLNRQGNDVGTQYRSVIFYTSDEQKTQAESLIKEFNDTRAYDKPVVTEVISLEKGMTNGIETVVGFYPAENYHQNYYETHKDAPYCQLVIAPKLDKLQEKFGKLINN